MHTLLRYIDAIIFGNKMSFSSPTIPVIDSKPEGSSDKYSINKINLKQLDWITDYKDPKRFDEIRRTEIYALFNEIAHQKSISDIIIQPDMPIMVKVKRRGLFAITHRVIHQQEATSIVRVLTEDPNAVSRALQGETKSGTARVIDGDIVDLHNLQEYEDMTLPEKGRYRYELVGARSHSNDASFSMVLRPLPKEPLPYDKLNIPLSFVENFIIKDGIAIIAGATGEGKTTTLSAVIRYIMEHDTIIKGNIVTHEDPVEISYDNIKSAHSYVTQSAIGPHISTFGNANRAAMRRSPDLILVGELRDSETMDSALELAVTGHPAFATVHANSVAAILPRLLSRFPKEQQSEKCFDIISSTRLLSSQKLIWTTENKLLAVREALPITPQLRQYLLPHCGKPSVVTRKLHGIMREGMFGVEDYAAQGKKMLDSGLIDEVNYKYLTEDAEVFDEETIAKLDEL